MASKKTIKKKTSKKNKENKKVLKREEKQMVWFFIVICLVFLVFFGSYYLLQSQKKYSYAGMNWDIQQHGKLEVHHAIWPLIYKGETVLYKHIYFRNDPRKNKVPILTNFSMGNKVSLSYEQEAFYCKDSVIGVAELSGFLQLFPWVKEFETGLFEYDMAKALGENHITCADANEKHTVYLVKNGENASIRKITENCYEINIENCNNMETVERFILGVVSQINGIEI